MVIIVFSSGFTESQNTRSDLYHSKLFYFSIIVDIQYCISFKYIAQWLDIYITYAMISPKD